MSKKKLRYHPFSWNQPKHNAQDTLNIDQLVKFIILVPPEFDSIISITETESRQ